jgi:hypothetical protein
VSCGPITAAGEKDFRSDIPTEVQVINRNISRARGRRDVYTTTAMVVAKTKAHMAACGYVGKEIAVCQRNVSENRATVRSNAPTMV